MTVSRDWPAPVKLNLFLHITGRRADGYHLLQTVFQLLDHGDRLDFEILPDPGIDRAAALPGVAAEQDLTLRAARLLQEHAGVRRGVRIRLHKRAPMGGGLGGGSSDAATTLVALNHLWDIGLSLPELEQLGLRLGADVPIFVRGQSAWAEGVGERISPISLPSRWFAVVTPPVAVSTATVFADPDLTRNCTPITIGDFLSGSGGNVCQTVVERRYPEVEAALRLLGRAAPARMTGTGASVFAAFADQESARRALQDLPSGWNGFVGRGLDRSPLKDRLAAEPAPVATGASPSW